MEKEKIVELDYVRVFSMLAVVLIHVTSTFIYADSKFMVLGMNLAFLFNQIMRFSVPLFVLLSGISLGFSKKDANYISFIRSRARKVLLPYIIWSFVYWVQGFMQSAVVFQFNHIKQFIRALILGNAASHLYFIVIIIQFYFIYPWMKRVMEQYPYQTLIIALAVSYILQEMIYGKSLSIAFQTPFYSSNLWRLFPTWGFYFVFGMFIYQIGVERFCEFGCRNLPLLAGAAMVFGFFYSYESHLTGSLNSVKPQLLIYVPLVLVSALGIGRRLSHADKLNRWISFMAGHSQTFFFSHLLILSFLRRVSFLVLGLRGMFILIMLELILSMLLSWLIDSAIHCRGHAGPASGGKPAF